MRILASPALVVQVLWELGLMTETAVSAKSAGSAHKGVHQLGELDDHPKDVKAHNAHIRGSLYLIAKPSRKTT
jgi:hypothetical protein